MTDVFFKSDPGSITYYKNDRCVLQSDPNIANHTSILTGVFFKSDPGGMITDTVGSTEDMTVPP